MTLKQKREICRRFKEGCSVWELCASGKNGDGSGDVNRIEQVIRDFMNGKFTLEPKREAIENARCYMDVVALRKEPK